MRHCDIAIVGGGLAGSLAAAMLGRADHDALLIDPHTVYPPDFRCEKFDDVQVGILEDTGLADVVRRAATPFRELWLAGFGEVLQRRQGEQFGILYDTLVNTVRGAIPAATTVLHTKVTGIQTSAHRQIVTLSGGDTVSARLVVLANGLNVGLRDRIGLSRKVISPCHSISIGFDIKPLDGPAFQFPALTYYPAEPADRMAYITLFPIGSVMRANLFAYRTLDDPVLRQIRSSPRETLRALMPGLFKLTGEFEVTDYVKIRPIDLYATAGHRQPGIVVVGDAFATGCPAGGTGARKVLMDVERLCNVHIPQWLETPGMDTEKISAFYEDPRKRECDRHSLHKAMWLRSFCTEPGLRWRMERRLRFGAYRLVGKLRDARRRLGAIPGGAPTPAATGAGS